MGAVFAVPLARAGLDEPQIAELDRLLTQLVANIDGDDPDAAPWAGVISQHRESGLCRCRSRSSGSGSCSTCIVTARSMR